MTVKNIISPTQQREIHTCERCGAELSVRRLTEKQTEAKFYALVEQDENFNGLAPTNEKFKNFTLISFLLHNCYTYFECVKCGWWKFKKC